MARSIYADPFGAYIGAYDKGVMREQEIQQNTRAARAADYTHYNIDPLTLQKLQRENEIGIAAQPYSLKLPAIGYENIKANALATQLNGYSIATDLGLTDPAAGALSRANGAGYTTGPDGQIQFVTPQLGTPMGQPISNAQLIEANPTRRAELNTLSQQQYTRELQNAELLNKYNVTGIAADRAAVAGQTANTYAQAVANQTGGRGGADPINHMFGDTTPALPPAAPPAALPPGALPPGAIDPTAPPTAPPTTPPAPSTSESTIRYLMQLPGATPTAIYSALQKYGTPERVLQEYMNHMHKSPFMQPASTPVKIQ